MPILTLALKSLLNRRFTALLTLLSIALSVALLLGVERVRSETRASFSSTISGTDLIVGARSGPVQLLLYSVFRIGNATNNISWQSYQDIAAHPKVAWTVPISLGDSHRGFRVLGTTPGYFDHYRYARDRRLEFAAGARFDDLFDAVLGAEVADALGYRTGRRDRHRPRRRRRALCAARRQAVSRRRHPEAHRHPGRSHRACQPGGDRGRPSGLAGRRADAGPDADCGAGARDGPDAGGDHGGAGGPEVEDRRLCRAALRQRLPRRTAARGAARRGPRRAVVADRCRRRSAADRLRLRRAGRA